METEQMSFPGATGATLSGILHHPEDRPRGCVLLAHCFTCGKDIHTMTRLASGLAETGFLCLRFDFTGLGDSGGQAEASTVSVHVRDLASAATALVARGTPPSAMVGHSLGGAATLLAAHKVHTARTVAVLGAPSTAQHVEHLFADDVDEILEEGCSWVRIGSRPFPISREFVEDLRSHGSNRVAELGRPLLVMHSPDDEIVPVAEGEATFAAARQPKGFMPLPAGTDHLVSSRAAADVVVSTLVAWLEATGGVRDDAERVTDA